MINVEAHATYTLSGGQGNKFFLNPSYTSTWLSYFIDSVLFSVRPLLMQSDLQSVGNGAISTFARAFAPKICETAVSRLRMTWTFLQDLSRAVSRFSMRPVAGNHLRYVSDQLGQIRLRSGIGSEKTFFPIQSGVVIVLDPVGSEKYRR